MRVGKVDSEVMADAVAASFVVPQNEAELGAAVEQLVLDIYSRGKIPSSEDNLFLNNLRHHPSALPAALGLLQLPKDITVHQFAASLLIQVLQTTDVESHAEQAIGQIVAAIRSNFHQETGSTVHTKIRRDLLAAIGYFLGSSSNWKERFEELARYVDPDFFQTNNPSPVVLDTFYVFRDFGLRRSTNSQEAFDIVAKYFTELLLRQSLVYDTRQAQYLQFITAWIEDLKYNSTPPPEVGKLMVVVARYVDCPERNQMPWSNVQSEAIRALNALLGLTDVHLLQNSLLEVLRAIVNLPIRPRAESMACVPDVLGYFTSVSQLLLTFALEFSDIIVASCENPNTASFVTNYIAQLDFLARPFPQFEKYIVQNATFTKNAVMAFSELASLMAQMSAMDKQETMQAMPHLKVFFGIIVKLSQGPSQEECASWTQQDKEDYREFLTEVQTAVESLALAVGKEIHKWIQDEFSAAFAVPDESKRNSYVASVCWVFRFCHCSRAEQDPVFFDVLGSLLLALQRTDTNCACEALRAVEARIGVLKDVDEEHKKILHRFMEGALLALKENKKTLTNACAGAIFTLLDTDLGHYENFYPAVPQAVMPVVVAKTTSEKSRRTFLQCLAKVFKMLPPTLAVMELEKMSTTFQTMIGAAQTPGELSTLLEVFGVFFRALATDAPDREQIQAASAQLGANVLNRLHELGVFGGENAFSRKLSESCAVLIKDILYGCGSAANVLLAAVVPVVVNMFRCDPSVGVFSLIGELLNSYLSEVMHEELFGQLITFVFDSVIDISDRPDWTEYSEVYGSFVLMAYPIVRRSGYALVRISLKWEQFLNFVLKLVLLLPSGRDSEAEVQSNVLLEELVRMKPRDVQPTDSFINPIHELLKSGYGSKFVHAMLTIFYDERADEQRVKLCSDCLFVMLTEMRPETNSWMQEAFTVVSDADASQQAAFRHFISSLFLQRSKSAFRRCVVMYRTKFRGVTAPPR